MKSLLASILLTLMLLTGCNLPEAQKPIPSTTPDLVATEVQKMLTKIPTSTNLPAAKPTDQPAVTATKESKPTIAPTFTPLPSQTSAPKMTATTNPGDPAVTLGKPTWTDTLDTAKNFYQDDNENTQIKVSDGAVVMTSKTAVGWHSWALTYAQSASDFYLQGTFKTAGCGGSDLYGLVFRADKENAAYFFGVTCDGQYSLYARDFNNNIMTKIIDLTPNAAILAGSDQVNRLGVLAKGDQIGLYVNGKLLEELSDDTYSKGYFGPFIAGETENFTSSMEEISLWKIN